MGRKNSNVRRSNDRKRLARQAAKDVPAPKVRQQPRLKVEDLVLPDGRCTGHGRKPKAWFATEEKAAKALTQAQRQRARIGSGHIEKRYYACPTHPDGGYHLTSRETYEERTRP